MGKQRTRVIKKQAQRIYYKVPDEFSTDFKKNKEALKKFELPLSKVNRNVMAGYLTNLVREKKKEN
ncbi:MAG: 30S ribosomal protein S17e [archaeon]